MASEGVEISAPPFPLSVPLSEAVPVETVRGTWFDKAVDFRDPQGEVLTKQALALISGVEKRERKRRPFDEMQHRIIVRRVLSNGLRCSYFRDPPLVAYSRRAEAYTNGPRWPSGKAMSRTVDLLAKAGLVESFIGKRQASSTYRVTEALRGLALATGMTEHRFIHRSQMDSVVRLRQGNASTPRVAFASTDDTIRWERKLRAYNAFLSQQDIRITLSSEQEADWVRHWNRKKRLGAVRLRRPELFQTELYRQFNNGSFEQGGRMYGGWWIDAPRTLRSNITINGQPTAELDFSGCAIRMLYHERGLECLGDTYRLDEIAEYEAQAGLPPDHFREGVKAITQALINDKDGKAPEQINLDDGLSFRPRFKRLEVRKMIENKHVLIADAFRTGAGLRLQRKDSDLALAIITELMDRNIVALPIHDSILVCRDRVAGTKITMGMTYKNMFGFYPVIKLKG